MWWIVVIVRTRCTIKRQVWACLKFAMWAKRQLRNAQVEQAELDLAIATGISRSFVVLYEDTLCFHLSCCVDYTRQLCTMSSKNTTKQIFWRNRWTTCYCRWRRCTSGMSWISHFPRHWISSSWNMQRRDLRYSDCWRNVRIHGKVIEPKHLIWLMID